MVRLASTLLNLLQPPYAWILCLVLVLPYWVLYLSVLFSRFGNPLEARAAQALRLRPAKNSPERDLARYASTLTAAWLLIVAFKTYQQFFAASPLPNSNLGLFDFSLGLFSLASWLGLLILRAQERFQTSQGLE